MKLWPSFLAMFLFSLFLGWYLVHRVIFSPTENKALLRGNPSNFTTNLTFPSSLILMQYLFNDPCSPQPIFFPNKKQTLRDFPNKKKQQKPTTRVGFCTATLWKRIRWFNLQGKIQILQSSNIILRFTRQRFGHQHNGPVFFCWLGYGKKYPLLGVLVQKKQAAIIPVPGVCC